MTPLDAWKVRCARRQHCAQPCTTCVRPPRRPDACYLAGPMSGLPELNAPAFRAAAARLRAIGFRVVSPLELGEARFGSASNAVAPEEYLRLDLEMLVSLCTQMALLPGWERSIGARCEVAVGLTLGLRFYDAQTGRERPRPVAIVDRGYRGDTRTASAPRDEGRDG